ncbi:MAG: coenzyme F420-0:L-glutamate ligase [Nitrososphaeraceae archaeon]|nr:coenzyme F420-0:L-glutamate ligase [Nitrososphaeraceae archaeon]MDW3631043.1 coenzyme F420-0:L-glutamate ligase [Nitrososphaeraceae archaeon]
MIFVKPIKIKTKKKIFNLFDTLISSEYKFKDQDILVLSSKFVSMSEGSVLDLRKIRPSSKAKKLAKTYQMEPTFVEVVIRESDVIFGGLPGFLLTIKNGILAPNAGIDKSNIPLHKIICLPLDPFLSAENLRMEFLVRSGIKVGIIISDSRLMPTRIGTTGVAIGCSGIEPVEDQRGKKDLFGHIMKYTLKATADSLATMGTFVMGESNESVPLVVIRGSNLSFTDRKLSWKDFAIDYQTDLYFRGIQNFSPIK